MKKATLLPLHGSFPKLSLLAIRDFLGAVS